MNKRDLMWRLGGALALLGAGGSSFLHRAVLLGHLDQPASALELVLGLTTFILMSLGILFVLRGASLRDGWVQDCEHAASARSGRPLPELRDFEPDQRNPFVADPDARAEGNAAVAMILADRAIRAAAASHRRQHRQPSIDKAGPIS